ncbi:hypothetical protein GQ464_007740 [Rhodocaloribacter litoris]|uniref:hypothetical protein n=1 Tax=Rhodocaloribacter litoris TaxID=2558931 RepID=UPI0014211A52|nr:hypothetical protein [Rhodocaloribacter litoris]QXD16819.1 hypothetical protein GQ464_007740 [Rhodocaloribacter litoris]GIV60544.1 MAG: hypothetical protein KatS3mg043_1633 [Rhodothermaceae bacterium]
MTTPARTPRWPDRVALALAAVTILSGAGQIVAARPVLSMLAVEPTTATVYLFVTVSLLTLLFGGALLHAVLARRPQPVAVLWTGLQKVCGAALGGAALTQGLLAGAAWAAVAFDGVAGLFVLWYWTRVRKR